MSIVKRNSIKIYSITISCFLLIFTKVIYCEKIIEMPTKYLNPTNSCLEKLNKKDIDNTENSRAKNSVWFVYSDRDNNITYETNNTKKIFKKLSFLEEFFVSDESGEYVRLLKDDGIDGLKTSEKAIDFGWIHKSKLLLWKRCMIEEKGLIQQKAMLNNTVKNVAFIDFSKPNIVKFTKGPALSFQKTGYESNMYKFFFVFKKIQNSKNEEYYLLGNNSRLFKRKQFETIVGWVPANRLTLWNTRIAIEPNWEFEAVEERKNGCKAKFFIDIPAARKYKEGHVVDKEDVYWQKDTLGNRPIGEWRRFPLIYLRESGLLSANVMGDIHQEEQESISSIDNAEIQRKIDSIINKLRYINLIFVIDATKSMEEYYMPIVQAINDSKAILNQYDRIGNKYKIGAVIYRDISESSDRQKKFIRLCTNFDEIIKFLREVKAGDKKNNSKRESVFLGLKVALQQTGMKSSFTNIIVLVGDAGNHIDNNIEKTKNEISQLLSKKNCHLFVFQVHNDGHQAYRDFVSQLSSIMKKTANLFYDSFKEELDLDLNLKKNLKDKIRKPVLKTNKNISKFIQGPYSACLVDASLHKVVPPENLKKILIQFIQEIDQRNNKLIESLKNISENGIGIEEIIENDKQTDEADYVSSFTDRIVFLLKTKAGLEPNQINKLIKNRFQLSTRLTSTMYVKGQKHPLFKKVVLFTRMELNRLQLGINKLYDAQAVNIAEERKVMVKAWKELLKHHIGNITAQEMEEMDLQEIFEMKFGIPSQSEAIRSVKLKDIVNEREFPDGKFRSYVERVKEKSNILLKILDSGENYPYRFRSNEIPYFWIDLDLIP